MSRSMSFPETLVGDVEFPSAASAPKIQDRYRFAMRLQWFIANLDDFFDDPRHTVAVTGRVRCDPLGGDIDVVSGFVELFAEDAGRTVMNYRLKFSAGNGEALELRGAKQIIHDRAKDLWPDTTSLPIEVRQAQGRQELVVSGTLHLNLARVLRAIAGMRATGGPRQAIGTVLAFDRFFLAKLASVYLHEVRPARRHAAVG